MAELFLHPLELVNLRLELLLKRLKASLQVASELISLPDLLLPDLHLDEDDDYDDDDDDDDELMNMQTSWKHRHQHS